MAEIRRAVALRVAATSLRLAAREIGLPRQTLHSFVHDDTEPYGKTLLRLREWYARAGVGADAEATIRAAVSVLLDGIPEGEREGAVRYLLDHLAEIHRRAGVNPPEWVKGLISEDNPNND